MITEHQDPDQMPKVPHPRERTANSWPFSLAAREQTVKEMLHVKAKNLRATAQNIESVADSLPDNMPPLACYELRQAFAHYLPNL